MSAKVIELADRRPPVVYTVEITHYWDDTVSFMVKDAADDPRSQRSIADALERMASALRAAADQKDRAP